MIRLFISAAHANGEGRYQPNRIGWPRGYVVSTLAWFQNTALKDRQWYSMQTAPCWINLWFCMILLFCLFLAFHHHHHHCPRPPLMAPCFSIPTHLYNCIDLQSIVYFCHWMQTPPTCKERRHETGAGKGRWWWWRRWWWIWIWIWIWMIIWIWIWILSTGEW